MSKNKKCILTWNSKTGWLFKYGKKVAWIGSLSTLKFFKKEFGWRTRVI